MESLWAFGGLTWKDLGRRLWKQIVKDDVIARAAQLSYFFLFALFPLLFFLISLLGYFTIRGSEMRESLLRYLGTLVPAQSFTLIRDTLDEISRGTGGGKLSFGLLLSLWTASFGMGAVISTLNAAYGVEESRPFWKSQLISISLTAAVAVLIIVALLLLLYGESIGLVIAAAAGLGDTFVQVWNVVQWPVVLAFLLFVFALVYYIAPNVETLKWQWITPGSVLGLAVWLAVSFLLRVYLHYFDTYSKTYGSLGAVMVLLLWLYLTGVAILVGGELNAVIEDAAARAGYPEAKVHGEKTPGDQGVNATPEAKEEVVEREIADQETAEREISEREIS